MGKISDALDRYKKEKSVREEKLFPVQPERLTPGSPELVGAGKLWDPQQWNPKLVLPSDPESIDAENFKVLRAQLMFARDRERPRVIMVTSTFPGEGKTYVAANLAVSIALGIDEHVLAIDCDLRRPHLHEMFGYANSEGLHEYLMGRKSLPELIVRSKIDKLSILPAGSVPRNPTELLSSSKMEDFLNEIRSRYSDRFIVIDSTPSHVTAEASALARHVDGIVFVVMARKSPRKAVLKALDKIGRDKIRGIVFNGYDMAHKEYHKYYRKYYGTAG